MRILVDSNILISAALNAKGTPYKAFLRAVTHPNKGLICDQNLEELLAVEVIPTPNEELEVECQIRDVADRPILRAAIKAQADILLTGDKDFLEASVKVPKIMTAAEFLKL